jgi:hypothetical protein
MAWKATTPAPRGKTAPPAQTPAPARTAQPAATNGAATQPTTQNGAVCEDSIRTRAYALWEQAGRPESDGIEFWLRAEKELNAAH